MDGEKASRFVSSLVKSIQALCNGYIDFSSSIEVIGHIHLNIDRSVKLDYVLTEEVSKSISEGATVFASHSYHSQPSSSVSSKNASDSSNRNRSKQTHGDDGDSVGFRSSTSDVHNTPSKSDSHSHKRSSSHFGENNESCHAGGFVDTGDLLSLKQENRQKSCHTPESSDKRRRSVPSQSQFHHQSSSSAAKRSRPNDCNPEQDPQNFEVIEIKEEPDEEPSVFFGNSSSHMASGQDLQTPDFSNVVMESLDRVGQVEGTDLVASGEGGQMQQQPFPVMMHSNSGMPSASSSMPGPSQSDPQAQSLASTSGSREAGAIPVVKSEVVDCEDSVAHKWIQSSAIPLPEHTVHFMERIPPKGNKTNTQKRCCVCKKMGLRKDSRMHCVGCPEKPGLCRGTDCFSIYHQWKGIHVNLDRRLWNLND